MWSYNTTIVLIGSALLGAASGMLGCFAVLRRRGLLGDVVAHSALPGIAIAFWLTQSKSIPLLLSGALATGLIGIWLLAAIKKQTKTKEDAAMALVLSVLFGAGICISRIVQSTITDGSQAGLDNYIFGQAAGIIRSDISLLFIVLALSLISIFVFFKVFKLIVFDPNYAVSLGWKTSVLDFSLMSLLVLTVIVGLPMVGIIMMAAMILIPAVSARFWTHNLSRMLVISSLIGIISAVSGVIISSEIDKLPTGPTIILCAGAFFIFSALFAPSKGVLFFAFRQLQFKINWGTRTLLIILKKSRNLGTDNAAAELTEHGIYFPRFIISQSINNGYIMQSSSSRLNTTKKGLRYLEQFSLDQEETPYG